MFIDRETREEMNKLSREVFGSASRWTKLVEKGAWVPKTKEVVETIPSEDGSEPKTETKVVNIMGPDGKPEKYLKRYTIEEVKNMMVSFKAVRDQFMADQKKIQAQKELEKQVQEKASGTAIS